MAMLNDVISDIFSLYIKYSLIPTPCLIYGDISLK